ncbi:hypothetical protein [uncultured Tateyamaria sp.]|uniref:hypothetical protein n=1 Tax=uncultured Tateyamaria sp. TaxID=455651 RepID=UPI0026169FBD|nr:hypothetical protein [uncultured Tateyamaria sp.]
MVHLKTLSGQQDTKPPIPEPATLICQFTQPPAQDFIAPFLLLVLEDGLVQGSQLGRPTLGQAVPIHHIRHSSSFDIGRQ